MTFIYLMTASYFAGILAGRAMEIPLWLSCPAALACAAAALFYRAQNRQYFAAVCLLSFFVSLFMYGVDRTVEKNISLNKYMLRRGDEAPLEKITGTVVKTKSTASGSLAVSIEAERLRVASDEEIRVNGKVTMWLRPDLGIEPRYGEKWTFEGWLKPLWEIKPRKQAYMRLEGIHARFYPAWHGVHEKVGGGDLTFNMRVGGYLRARFLRTLETYVDPPYNQILGRMLLGKAQDIDPEVNEVFRRAGLSHVLVVSGMHVWFMLGIFMFFGFMWNRKPVVSFLVLGLVLVLYYSITGGGPSIVRATLMGGVFLAAMLFGADYHARSALAFAALIMMVMNPMIVFHVGAQLTFLASAGVVFIYPALSSYFPGRAWWFRIVRGMLVAISAQLPIYPVIAYYFNQFNIVSPVSNLLVVPLVGVVLPLDLLTCLAGLLPGPVAAAPAFLAQLVAALMYWITSALASFRFASVDVASPPLWWMILYWTCLGVVVNTLTVFRKSSDIELNSRLLAAGALAAAVAFSFLWRPPMDYIRATFIDVSEGDSTLVELPADRSGFRTFRALFDAGGTWGYVEQYYNPGEKAVGVHLKRHGIRRLDAAAITHPDADHMNGMLWVVSNVRVDRLLDSGLPPGSSCKLTNEPGPCRIAENPDIHYDIDPNQRIRYEDIVSAAVARGAEYVHTKAGVSLILESGARISFISPDNAMLDSSAWYENRNNMGTVARITYGNGALLIPADIEFETEERLASIYGGALKSSLMKSPHHGSSTSSSWRFLKAVDPDVAVISTGGPAFYGHPHFSTLDRYRKLKIRTFRTDKSGTVSCRIYKTGEVSCTPEFSMNLQAAFIE